MIICLRAIIIICLVTNRNTQFNYWQTYKIPVGLWDQQHYIIYEQPWFEIKGDWKEFQWGKNCQILLTHKIESLLSFL